VWGLPRPSSFKLPLFLLFGLAHGPHVSGSQSAVLLWGHVDLEQEAIGRGCLVWKLTLQKNRWQRVECCWRKKGFIQESHMEKQSFACKSTCDPMRAGGGHSHRTGMMKERLTYCGDTHSSGHRTRLLRNFTATRFFSFRCLVLSWWL
jgi:hypothetical protein